MSVPAERQQQQRRPQADRKQDSRRQQGRRAQQGRRPDQAGQAKGAAATPVGLWHPSAVLPPPEPISLASDPAAMLRSLGPPPLPGQDAIAEHYLAAVVERAAGLAIALAASVDLLAPSDLD